MGLPKWHIVSQVQSTEISDTGPGFDTFWKVTYKVDDGPAKGTRGEVHMPLADHKKDNVKAAVDAAVFHLDEVAAL